MKKTIAYYLEDHSRLDEVDVTDLKDWIEGAPYSQPLHKLMSIKIHRLGQIVTDVEYQNAAYHNIDLDSELSLGNQQSKSIDRSTLNLLSEPKIEEVGSGALISHAMASDEKEELVEDELLEEEDILHTESISEAVVENVKSVEQESDFVGEYIDTNLIYLDVLGEVVDESLDVLDPIEVDYKPKDIETEGVVETEKVGLDVITYLEKGAPSKKEVLKQKPRKEKKPKAKKKSKKSSESKKVKTKAKAEKIKKIATKKKKSAKAVINQAKPIAKEIRYVYIEERQDSDFRVHEYEGESEYIKWLMSKKSINQEKIVAETKKIKSKSKKKARAISKKKSGKATKEQKLKKSKKTSNKKSEKISAKKMVLKAAEQSVKKRDIIISETLADLLAAQGYNKKAKKMYKQLSLIFPEKSSFFAARIKKLKKK